MHLQGIGQVEVLKRTTQPLRFTQVELRIGNVDHDGFGAVLLDGNPVAGFFAGPDSDMTAVIPVVPPASGRFVTLQAVSATDNYLSIDEVNVFEVICS